MLDFHWSGERNSDLPAPFTHTHVNARVYFMYFMCACVCVCVYIHRRRRVHKRTTLPILNSIYHIWTGSNSRTHIHTHARTPHLLTIRSICLYYIYLHYILYYLRSEPYTAYLYTCIYYVHNNVEAHDAWTIRRIRSNLYSANEVLVVQRVGSVAVQEKRAGCSIAVHLHPSPIHKRGWKPVDRVSFKTPH